MPKVIKPKFDFSKVDMSTVDPDRLKLGTDLSDCALIASTFERGAHSTPTEAAVYATLSRVIQNKKQFANVITASMGSYLEGTTDSISSASKQAETFSTAAGVVSGASGDSAATDHGDQALNIGDQIQVTRGNSFGEKLLASTKNCIPCSLRFMALVELKPSISLMDTLKTSFKNALKIFNAIADLLKNLDVYGDFCNLIKSLSFMCIQDLQRILAALMALFMLDMTNLDGMIGILQALIAPIFAPILLSITSLLDKFNLLVTSPLSCVITLLQQAQSAQGMNQNAIFGVNSSFGGMTTTAPSSTTQVFSGLSILTGQINEAVFKIDAKAKFYTAQVKAMLGEISDMDAAYLAGKLRSLQIVRMAAFVASLIEALVRGHISCDGTQSPEQSEINNFFDNFLNPQSSYNISIDPDGNLNVRDKDYDSPILSNSGNVVQFEGDTLLDLNTTISKITSLSSTSSVIVPCKLEIKAGDVDRVNQWIAELNQA